MNSGDPVVVVLLVSDHGFHGIRGIIDRVRPRGLADIRTRQQFFKGLPYDTPDHTERWLPLAEALLDPSITIED